MNEDSIIRQIRNWCYPTHLDSTIFGIGDDAAAIQPSGRPLLFCSDMTIQNEHFNLDYSQPSDVGYKSIARALSDLAAMGSRPLGVTVSIALPKSWDARALESFLKNFYEGAVAISHALKAPIVGGDLTRIDGPITIDIAAIGEAPAHGRPWRRSGACPYDLVFVTGTLGGAAFALDEMNAGRITSLSPGAAAKHLRPMPRFDVVERLATHPVHAAMDISDGLVRDALRLCVESNVSLVIEGPQLPLIEATHANESRRREYALSGGDDYELILIVAPDWAESPLGTAELRAVGATRIGKIEASVKQGYPEVFVTSEDGHRRLAASLAVTPAGHDPFRET